MNLVAYSFMSLYHVFDLAVGDPPPHGGAIRLHEEACVCTCKRACVCVWGGGGLASMQVDTSHKCGVYYKIETDIDK